MKPKAKHIVVPHRAQISGGYRVRGGLPVLRHGIARTRAERDLSPLMRYMENVLYAAASKS